MSIGYIYKAAIYCVPCGDAIRGLLDGAGLMPADVDNDASYDTDNYPKGPFVLGETDAPEHCGNCQVFLLASLTEDGEAYVRDAIANDNAPQEWIDAYRDLVLDDVPPPIRSW